MDNIVNNGVLNKTLDFASNGIGILSNVFMIAWPITIVSLVIYFN